MMATLGVKKQLQLNFPTRLSACRQINSMKSTILTRVQKFYCHIKVRSSVAIRGSTQLDSSKIVISMNLRPKSVSDRRADEFRSQFRVLSSGVKVAFIKLVSWKRRRVVFEDG